MKRAGLPALLTVLMLTLLLAFCGCNEDKTLARECMQEGDCCVGQIESCLEEMERKEDEIVDMIAAHEWSEPWPGEIDMLYVEILGIRTRMKRYIEKARAEYEAIKALSGPDDYMEYADTMLLLISSCDELLALHERESDAVGQEIEVALATGEPFDILSFLGQIEDVTKAEELAIEINELHEEAEDLKRDRSL